MVPPRHLLLALVAGALALGSALAGDATPAPATLSGVIRDVKGKPMAGAVVSVEGGGETRTAKDGTWTIPGVAPGDALVTAKILSHGRVQALLRVAAGESRRWDATVGPAGEIRGHVVDEYGQPLARLPGRDKYSGWWVCASPEQEWMKYVDSEGWYCPTAADGSFRLRVSPDALFRLVVGRTDSQRMDLRTWTLLTEPMSGGLSDITLRVLPANMPHARLRCRLEDYDGNAVTGPPVPEGQKSIPCEAGLRLRRVDGDARGHAWYAGLLRFDAAQGVWISNQVPTGTYAVVTEISGTRAFEFPPVEVRDAADVDIGTLRFPKPGRVRFVPERSGAGSDRVVRVGIRRVASLEPYEWGGAGGWGGWWCGGGAAELAGNDAIAERLCPGRYVAWVDAVYPPFQPTFGRLEIPFEVRSGDTTDVKIPIHVAPVRTFHLRCAGTCASQAMAAFLDSTGVVVGRWWTRLTAGWDGSVCLAPGHYDVVVLTSDRRRLTGTLDIPAEDPPESFDVVVR